MTIGTHSMPLPVHGSALPSTAPGLSVHVPPSTADAIARDLADSVGRGNEAAFRELYDRYHDRVFRFALILCHGDESLAGETMQSVFVTAAAKLRCVESEAHLWNWLARVARQQLSQTWRERRHDSEAVPLSDLPDCSDRPEADGVLEEKLEAALQLMEASERQLIEWFYFDGLSHKELAERLRSSSKAVSSRLERARARLRQLLNKTSRHET